MHIGMVANSGDFQLAYSLTPLLCVSLLTYSEYIHSAYDHTHTIKTHTIKTLRGIHPPHVSTICRGLGAITCLRVGCHRLLPNAQKCTSNFKNNLTEHSSTPHRRTPSVLVSCCAVAGSHKFGYFRNAQQAGGATLRLAATKKLWAQQISAPQAKFLCGIDLTAKTSTPILEEAAKLFDQKNRRR